MDTSLRALVKLNLFSTGRRLFVLDQVRKLAVSAKFKPLEEHCAEALKHDRHTRQIEQAWQARSVRQKPTDLVRLVDAKVDKTLSAIRDSAAQFASALEPNDPLAEKAIELVQSLFPAGLQAVISANYIDELSATEAILAKLKGPLAPTADEIGLSPLVKRLTIVTGEYRAALHAPAPNTLDFGSVREARAKGQSNLLQVVAMVLGKYPSDSETDVAARTRLLQPVLVQNEVVSQMTRARRGVPDLDPTTGEPDTDESQPDLADETDEPQDE